MKTNQVAKFVIIPIAHAYHSPTLFVSDYKWWCSNQEEIETWMRENLPNGTSHLQGMVLSFESVEDRAMFLLRFGL